MTTTPAQHQATPVPALFISHGAPLFALEPGETGPALTRWGQALRERHTIRGIVLLSPHWMAHTPAVMTNPAPATWHDFGGFPAPLYQLQYPAPGDPDLATRVLQLLQSAGLDAQADARRPLDHGAWVPLMHLFPQADLPVVQVALPAQWGPQDVFGMGQALSSLRDEGVLLIGTGSMTHNLAEFFGGQREPAPYVVEFSRWVESTIAQHDADAMLDYRARAPHARRAHPSEDHFLPVYFALGAGGWGMSPADAPVEYLSREVMYGMLAMDTFSIGDTHGAAVLS